MLRRELEQMQRQQLLETAGQAQLQLFLALALLMPEVVVVVYSHLGQLREQAALVAAALDHCREMEQMELLIRAVVEEAAVGRELTLEVQAAPVSSS